MLSLFSCCYDRILDKQQLKAGWGGVYFGSQFEGIQSAMVGDTMGAVAYATGHIISAVRK